MIYDGAGGAPYEADVAVNGDEIAGIGDYSGARGRTEIDAAGLAVSPGFINMMSWAVDSLMVDGRAQSDIRQGVTLEVFGEGESWGPVNERTKEEMLRSQGDIRYDIEWTSLGDYLEFMEARGVAPNFASYIGATTVRNYVIGEEDRAPTAEELAAMQELVREAMREGALGVASALIYAPGFYAKTDELVALASAAGEFGGMYTSHLRSEGNALLEGVYELIEIARQSGVRAEIYHFKQAGRANWPKIDAAIAAVEAARAEGLEITSDMYTYNASSTGLDTTLPPWSREGGQEEFIRRLKNPEIRASIIADMRTPTDRWAQYLAQNGPENIMLVGFKSDALKPLTGKRLSEVAAERGTSAEDTIIDLLIEDNSRIDAIYFAMSEENVKKALVLPWMSICSDSPAIATEGVFLKSMTHPRTYGSFARLLGKYVREEKTLTLQEAVRKMTSLPAHNLRIEQRGLLAPGYYADIAIFNPDTITDNATFAEPHQYATGMVDVFVNGEAVLRDGEPTGALPGRVVRGPGWEGRVAR
ncbi:amidohydrolase family protein [Marinicaulis aureus]|uniref:Amidohydrolase family protein n=1 Tax=Hyphococcus aureus TaxID=2666033 RepID=A0ABW1KVT8_9PROT